MPTIFFDLETTGPGQQSDIISIGAVAVDDTTGEELDDGRFEKYIFPRAGIMPGASRVNGFKKVEGVLMKWGEPVEDAVTPKEGLKAFVDYLREQDRSEDGGLKLVAHNCFRFDSKVLANNLRKFAIEAPGSESWTLLDTVTLAKKYDPSEHGPRGKDKLAVLLTVYLGTEAKTQTHDALDDTLELVRVVNAMAEKKKMSFKEIMDLSDKLPFSSC